MWIHWDRFDKMAILVRERRHDRVDALAGITVEEVFWHPKGGCGDALDKLDPFGRPYAVTSVGFTRRGDAVRQHGYGRALYRAVLLGLAFGVDPDARVLSQLWDGRGLATLVPDACGGVRPTSDSARRAWSILAGELPHASFSDRKGELFVLSLPGPMAVDYADRNDLLDAGRWLRDPMPADALRAPFGQEKL